MTYWIIAAVVDVLRRVSLRIVTMPIQSQGIITRDNVSVDVSAVAYFRVVDATKFVFPAPLMSTIGELGTFLAREAAAAVPVVKPVTNGEAVANR
ncbi:SPFH domain-containing protein [Amycolatopsis sp. NPDC049252]|uniref:SPFH domain-containing protein n=1 Tax=Amycolatopsis sp. NPDC049252 TaxID=3363933 RepID=UPI00371A5A2D